MGLLCSVCACFTGFQAPVSSVLQGYIWILGKLEESYGREGGGGGGGTVHMAPWIVSASFSEDTLVSLSMVGRQ